MPDYSLQTTANAGGLTVTGTTAAVSTGVFSHDPTLPIAQAGSLTTRTDDNTGVCTLATGHGVANGTVDVYWDGGIRYGMTATVDGNDVTVDGGAGDNLPAEDTSVTVAVPVTISQEIIGDTLEMLAWVNVKRGHIRLQASGGSIHLAQEMIASAPWAWVTGAGIANPIAGDTVDEIVASNGDSTATSQLKLCGAYDSDG